MLQADDRFLSSGGEEIPAGHQGSRSRLWQAGPRPPGRQNYGSGGTHAAVAGVLLRGRGQCMDWLMPRRLPSLSRNQAARSPVPTDG